MKFGVLILGLLVLLAGCSTLRPGNVIKDRKAEYKSARSLPPLEVPPELAPPSHQEAMTIPSPGVEQASPRHERKVALTRVGDVRLERAGDMEWLVIKAPPEVVWEKVRAFWLKNGFVLKMEDPRLGIMETDWAENRADIPQGPVRKLLGKVLDQLYSTATRDKFRVRIEAGKEPGTTELYLAHRGMEEVVQGESTVWQPRPSDPELEAEMLKRLMVFLGMEEEKAKAMVAKKEKARARLSEDDRGSFVLLDEGFSNAWRRVGLALDRLGFTVEDRDRSQGRYFIRYLASEEGQKGWLSRLAFWKGEKASKPGEYVIEVAPAGEGTKVWVHGKEKADAETARRILKLLYEELK